MSRAYTTPIQYGPNGCQVNIDGSQTCRETQTLEIIKEFNRVYESKLQELGSIGGGDNLLAKLHLQQDWIRDLTQQNEMLVKAVEELEKDAAERVSMLEERLQNGAQVMRKCKDNCSVYLNETFQKMDYLYNDVHNLVEFVKRVRDNKQWSIEGLDFYTINASCLLKPCSGCCDCLSFIQNIPVQDNQPSQQKQEIVTQEAKALDNLYPCGIPKFVEVANRHDEILSLRRDLQKVEAECRNADEVIKCKDNKIKELVWQINCLKQKIIKLEDKKAVQETLKPVPPKPVSPKLRKRPSNRNKQSNNYSSICACDKPIVIKQNEVEVSRENYPKQDCSKLCSRDDTISLLLHTELDHVANAEVDSSPKKEIVSSWLPTNKPSHLQYLCLYEGDVRENDRNALKGDVARNNFLFTSENCFYSSNTHRIAAGKSNLVSFRIADIETDSTDLRKKFKELETENTTLKDTIFQANRELEKFYEQANDYLKDRDEYKRKFKESTDALETIQNQFKSEKQALERKVVAQEDTIKKMNSEQVGFLIKEELINTRRQSDSLTQAQNETIQALQEAMREKDKTSELVRVIPLTSEESWTSTSESTSRAKGFPIPKSSGYNDDAVSMSAELAVCAKDTCSSTCDGLKALEKVQKERDLERKIHRQEVENLKKTIEELEKGGVSMDAIIPLQEVNELSKLEISQQRITISNLQEALKVCKNQLDDLQQRSSSDIKKLNAFIDRLQDANLELEVKIFEYIQDVALLETRLLKYQFSIRMPKEQNQLVKRDLTSENNQLRNKVDELECECEAMRRIVNEAKDLHKSFIMMQTSKDDFQLEARHAQKELMREAQLQSINNARIKELQQRLGEKTCEISQCGELLRNLQNKLCWTVCQNNQLKNEITTLITHINNYEENYIDNDKRTDLCQKEIEVCKDNLTDLKDKLLVMKGLLQQKIDEYSQLETEFCIQNNSLACMKEQISLSEKQYQEEVEDLRCLVEQLQAKLAATEATCRCLREDYQRSQATIEEYNQIESELRKQFTNKLNEAQNEITGLNNYVAQLKEECCCIKRELKVKEQQIGAAKAKIVHFKASENTELIAAQEEIDRLRTELSQVFQQHEVLKNKNEALCMQLCEVKQSAIGFQHQTNLNEQQFHQCLCELEFLRHAKKQLEAKNDELRCAYHSLCIKYKQLIASVPILNNEIIEYKSKNDDLLSESRNLINNVRAWLENQALINRQVAQKFNDDHLIISKLSKKLVSLENQSAYSSRLHAGSNVDTFEESLPSDLSLHTEETTQSFTVNDNSDDCSLDNCDFNEPFTKTWLKKVEGMTKDLQKSSEYWQSKMSDDYLVTKDQ
ncbi:hypothetical protein RN001_008889 [Aquatica leii]|uniref:Uncharacterized protein n=1 Tax=Aquatica leii TaxID=1421715 RepID=A0AAN7QJA6_9COLE|nr:hypothetical protein RN001_008889 [Aquatica leii]